MHETRLCFFFQYKKPVMFLKCIIFLFFLEVGGLLQSKFTSGGGMFSQLPEIPFGAISQKLSKPAATESPWPSLSTSIILPPPAPEVTLRTVGARRLGGPVPLDNSVTQGKGRLLMDAALYMGRSFRVGWGPNWTLVHCGNPLSTSSESKDQNKEDMSFSFLPRPVKTRQ